MRHLPVFLGVIVLAGGCFSDPGGMVSGEEGSSDSDTDTSGTESTTEDSSETGVETDVGSEGGMDVPPDLPPEEKNWALVFDGDDAGTSPLVDVSLSDSFTVELWARFDMSEYYGVLLDTRSVNVPDQGWAFYIDPPNGAYAGHLVFYYNGEDSLGHYLVGPSMDGMEDWHHLAAVRRDTGALNIYVDGVMVAANNFPQLPGSGSAKVLVGRQYSEDAAADSWWRGGVLDDVHVSDIDRYMDDFTPEAAAMDGNSIYLWRFNEGKGGMAWDDVNDIPLTLDAPEWAFIN